MPDAATTERTATLAATRAVVDEWLAHIAAGRTEPMWALTTREQGGLSLDVSQAWAFPSIRAKYVLGNDHAAMVVSTRYKDNAGRTRVLLCTLVKRDGRWLIQEHLYGNPDDIQLRVAGFAAYPGVQYDVRTEDLVGQWKTFFFTHSTLHTFRTDGSGETQERKGEYRGKTTPFRWEVVGNVLRRHVADQSYEGTVVRLDDEQFSVRHGNGEVGYVREPEPRATRP